MSPGVTRRRLPGRALALALALGVRVAVGAPTPEELADLEARIEYAYYAGDARALEDLAAAAAANAGSSVPFAAYQAAHAEFRRARLLRETGDTKGAEAAASRCEHLATEAASHDGAEAAVLQASCNAYTHSPSTRAILRALKSAHDADPANPRLLLAEAYRAALGGSSPPGAALTQARAAASAFAHPRATARGGPTWGEPDAWLLVGRCATLSGDALAARDAFEHSLVLAPDSTLARRYLSAGRIEAPVR